MNTRSSRQYSSATARVSAGSRTLSPSSVAGDGEPLRVRRARGGEKVVGGFAGDEAAGAQAHAVARDAAPHDGITGGGENRRPQRPIEAHERELAARGPSPLAEGERTVIRKGEP